LAWGTVVVEFSLAFGLFIRPVRLPLVLVGAIFHGIIYMTMAVFTFTATILLLYLAFFDPGEVHRGLDKLLGCGTRESAGT
jgi:hypothetical protein